MYWNEIKKLSSAGGFLCGIIILIIKLARGQSLLHSSYMALITMFISAIIFLFALKGIGRILTAYLMEKKREAEEEELNRILESRKQQEEERQQKLEEAKQATAALRNKARQTPPQQNQPT